MLNQNSNVEGWLDPQKIPDKATGYILFQRTNYINFKSSPSYLLLKKINPHFAYKLFVWIEGKTRKQEIKQLYMQDMNKEFETFVDFLPQKCQNIIDIGCGLAGVDIYLYHHYSRAVGLTLLDRSKTDAKVRYNFRNNGAFYNSLSIAKENLLAYGVSEADIICIEANRDFSINVNTNFELIISLLSWGFHYPVDAYLNQVTKLMAQDARVIIDVRKNTDGIETLKSAFDSVQTIIDAEKYMRVCCQTPRRF